MAFRGDHLEGSTVQVATHVITGLAGAVAAMQRRAAQPFAPGPTVPRNPATAAKAAFSTAAEGIGKLLEAINVASSIIKVQTLVLPCTILT